MIRRTAVVKRNKRSFVIIATVVLLLLVPLVVMRFTDEVQWGIMDFVIMGLLLSTAGIACELLLRKVHKPKYRIIGCAAVFLSLLLIWAELAVGLFS